ARFDRRLLTSGPGIIPRAKRFTKPIHAPLADRSGILSSCSMVSSLMAEADVDRSTDNKQLIDTLRRSRLFRDYEGVFSKATGLALTLQPLEFWQLAHRGKKHENPFCAMLAEHPKSLAVCLRAHQE